MVLSACIESPVHDSHCGKHFTVLIYFILFLLFYLNFKTNLEDKHISPILQMKKIKD